MLSKNSYYHTLGYLIDPLDLLIGLISVQESQLVSGVYRMCWGPYLALTGGVGFDMAGTVAECTKRRTIRRGGLGNPVHIV